MAGNEVRIHTAVTGNAGKEIKDLKGAWETFQKKGAEGLAIGAGITAATKGFGLLDSAISTGIGFIGDSIEKASALNETMSKSEIIFGKNADAVADWAGGMDRAAGQSKQAALDAASGFAGLFKTVGIGIDQSTEMSEGLTQLGSDLASFFDTDVDQALDALKSGLNGESEPLRRFNVFLSETAVSAKLAQMGIKKIGGSFTEAQKATARYQIILDQTTDAQGDFARTSDSLANSQRATAAEIDNLQAEIGQELLPVVRDLSNWAKDEGVPALSGLLDVAKSLGTVLGTIPDAFGDSQDDLDHAHELALRMTDVDDAANKLSDDVPVFTKEVHRLGAAATVTTRDTDKLDGATKHLTDTVRRAVRPWQNYADKLDNASDALGDELFATGEAERALEEHTLALKDDIKELHKLEAIKHPTRAQREDILHTKDAIDDDKRSVIQAAIKLREMGRISYGQLIRQLRSIGVNIMADTDAARELRRALYAADAAMGGPAGHGGGGGSAIPHAAGGNAKRGELSLVGERGPELRIEGTDATYIDAGRTSSLLGAGGGYGGSSMADGQPIIVQVVLDGRVVAQATAPHVTKWQQDNRVFSAR